MGNGYQIKAIEALELIRFALVCSEKPFYNARIWTGQKKGLSRLYVFRVSPGKRHKQLNFFYFRWGALISGHPGHSERTLPLTVHETIALDAIKGLQVTT